MTSDERATLIRMLGEGREALLDAVSGLSAVQGAFSPELSRWSATECVEHVAIAEELMLLGLTQWRRPIADLPRRDDAPIVAAIASRQRRFSAPEAAAPAGRFTTIAEALAHFESARAKSRAYAETSPDDLRAFTTKHPLAGIVDCYQAMLILAAHPARHAEQIREIRAHPAFPRG